jgi:hypothetical protein
MDETQEEFQTRRRKAAERVFERVRRMYDFAPEPRDIYADVVTFHEDRGVLRIGFYCSRPEADDGFGAPTIPVARISFHFKMFRYYFEDWLKSEAGSDAASE